MSEKKICFVTSNQTKFEEAVTYFNSKISSVQLVWDNVSLFEVQTRDPRDSRAVALYKGKQAWDRVGNPILIEYSSIFLNKYGNFPGSLTKHVFKGIGYRGIFRLVDSGDNATITSTLVYVDEYGNANVFEGSQEGVLIKIDDYSTVPPLPFDQIFIPDGSDLTYDELRKKDPLKYEELCVRVQALDKFINHLKK